MDSSLRSHHGGIVLGLGILGLFSAFALIPLGIVAWVLGSRELRGMNEGRVDPQGRVVTQVGLVFGAVGTFLPIPVAIVWFVLLGFMQGEVTTIADPGQPDVLWVKTTYASKAPGSNRRPTEFEYREKLGAGGEWVKDGDFIHWAQDHAKLEEGTYVAGKRSGTWTFWNDDGSVDHARSGVYEDDVKVRD